MPAFPSAARRLRSTRRHHAGRQSATDFRHPAWKPAAALQRPLVLSELRDLYTIATACAGRFPGLCVVKLA